MSFWAIASYFNPAGYRTKFENYQRFNAALAAQGVNLYTQSCAVTTDTLWQKERLLNIALAHLPADCDKVAWLDCDILFENPKWAADASRLLDEVPIVQLFDQVKMLGADGSEMFTDTGFIARRRSPTGSRVPGAHGYAWAARRELIEKHGFYDRAIVGGGDVVMAHSIFGRTWPRNEPRIFTKAHVLDMESWSSRFHFDVQDRARFVPGGIKHLWHGSQPDRRYMQRHEIPTRHGFDPSTDLAMDAQGCWKWNSDKPDMQREVREYFFSRNEDAGLASPDASERVCSTVGGV